MARFIIMFYLLLCPGCTYFSDMGPWITFWGNEHRQESFPIRYSVCGFSEEETDWIRTEVEYWDNVAGTTMFQYEAGCSTHNMIIVNDTYHNDDMYQAYTFLDDCGEYLCSNPEVQLYRRWSTADNTRKAVILHHELGHVLGLGHGFKDGCLMHYNGTDEDVGLCEQEMKVFCDHYPYLPNCWGN